jgi:hypothetical protein
MASGRAEIDLDPKTPAKSMIRGDFESHKCFVCHLIPANETLNSMSKGPGHIQRELLAILGRHSHCVDTFDLAAEVYALQPGEDGVTMLSDAHLVSVRRALRGLQRARKVYRLGHDKRRLWANERTGLWFTIRTKREMSAALAAVGDVEKLRVYLDDPEWTRLFARAKALGVDYNTETPPPPSDCPTT